MNLTPSYFQRKTEEKLPLPSNLKILVITLLYHNNYSLTSPLGSAIQGKRIVPIILVFVSCIKKETSIQG